MKLILINKTKPKKQEQVTPSIQTHFFLQLLLLYSEAFSLLLLVPCSDFFLLPSHHSLSLSTLPGWMSNRKSVTIMWENCNKMHSVNT